ncbi:bifunctional serine/threonine-protein kinase/formylglycine-generating enzyme family protein [Pyxidicoccus trucidator]|uniref:bifunctional serine/threonine-protein kinase/formylglycine-generating enzyme family protein n=1 Tax=Pyxidicoccus trucidator TaxID=2709662 RepID=UPI0013DCD619|nr:bifunctional serine/threonine-protein kinase/formylglycine-generating enzyme family protein [Pyxidicoccus trucidator]
MSKESHAVDGDAARQPQVEPLPDETPLSADPPQAMRTVSQVPTPDQGLAWEPAGWSRNEPSPQGATLLPSRYKELGLLGQGGMGEVRRVHDAFLGRTVAMKLLRPDVTIHAESMARFIEEAQATAQLQHPGIVPVHDLGRLQDGRWYFTLKEISGRTLSSVITEVHEAISQGRSEASASGWTFRRLIESFHRVCETVAYAHTRGVLHRDLKPSNVMVGAFGEVLVLDWGLAKVRESSASGGGGTPLGTIRSQETALETQVGQIMGTPAYMSPEQARGEPLGPSSDVYSLGAILYQILSGRPPYEGHDALAVVRKVLLGAPAPPVRRQAEVFEEETAECLNELSPNRSLELEEASLPMTMEGESAPAELVALCMQAMRRQPAERPVDANELARSVEAWLAGEQRRAEALRLVARSEAMEPELASLRARVASLREEARGLRQNVAGHGPVESKLPSWEKEDAAEELVRRHDLLVLQYVQTLSSALNHAPHLAAAHERLADHYRAEHMAAEETRDTRAATRFEELLRLHDVSGRSAPYLKGDGALSLWTDPPGAEVELHRYVLRSRRLVTEPVRILGRTPLNRVTLPMGSYLLVLRAEGRVPVRYPIRILRQQHWDGIRPGGHEPLPIHLPLPHELGPDDLYVPSGWFTGGGDPLAGGSPMPLRSCWVDGFVMRRFPVTNAEYLAFLNGLLDEGREAEALQWAPRDRALRPEEPGGLLCSRDEHGRFKLTQDINGETWSLDGPVVMVDWHGAAAFTRWTAARTGLPWRLPGELEWEKAARGVDGRAYPWGDFLDPTWCNMRESRPGLPRIEPVDTFPADESPYFVRGLSGNVADWCLDSFRAEGPELQDGRYVLEAPGGSPAVVIPRGGNWYMDATLLRVAARIETQPVTRDWSIGLRLARGAPGAAPR